MDEKEYFKEVKQLEKKYSKILKDVNRSYPRAINLREEKRKFLMAIADDKFYNPKFKFKRPVIEDEVIEALENFEINLDNDLYGFKSLYKKKVELNIIWLKCLKTWGQEESSSYAEEFFGRPSFFLYLKARKFCKNYKAETVKFTILTPKVAANRLKKFTRKLTGINLRVQYADIASRMSIQASSGILKINPNERFTTRDIRRLKVHEIGVHFMRYYNGSKFGLDILCNGTPGYIETEEGLAAYVEEVKGVSSKAQLFVYAGRVIATYHAHKKSFYQIFEILKKRGFRDETAFAITYRAKRNMMDTSLPGGFTKDYVYFSGYNKVKLYAKDKDLRDLFIGKIRIEDLGLLEEFIKKNKSKIETIPDI